MSMYPNEGPLWPCSCLVGSPYCDCPMNTGAHVDSEDAVVDVDLADGEGER
jgi:hypothetical protein